MCEVLNSIDWNILSSVSTFLAVIVALISICQTQQTIKENLRISLFDKRLDKYLVIIRPYFKLFKFAELVQEKCDDYIANKEKRKKKSIHFVLDNQFKKSYMEIEPYYGTYLLSVFGQNVTEILHEIDSLCGEVDRRMVDPDIIDALNIEDIKKCTDKLLKLRRKLAFEISKFFNVDSEKFYEYMIKDSYDS